MAEKEPKKRKKERMKKKKRKVDYKLRLNNIDDPLTKENQQWILRDHVRLPAVLFPDWWTRVKVIEPEPIMSLVFQAVLVQELLTICLPPLGFGGYGGKEGGRERGRDRREVTESSKREGKWERRVDEKEGEMEGRREVTQEYEGEEEGEEEEESGMESIGRLTGDGGKEEKGGERRGK